MTLLENIKTRVSQKTYNDLEVEDKLIETLLDDSVYAPNHKMREPWRFIIIKGEAKEVLRNKFYKELSEVDKEEIDKKLTKLFSAPVLIAFIMPLSDDYDDEIEDIQANSMLVQNFLLLANDNGLSTHVKTPKFIQTDLFKSVLDLNSREIITCLVMLGYGDQKSRAKRRTRASSLTTYFR